MDSMRAPGLRARGGVRTTFRVLGLVLVLVVFTGFAGAGDDFSGGAPDGFVVFAPGGFLTVIGLGLLGAGSMGASARFDAGETMPVVKGIASYLTDGQGVLGMGRRLDEPAAAIAAGPYCRGCGVRSNETAQFCDSRGRRLV